MEQQKRKKSVETDETITKLTISKTEEPIKSYDLLKKSPHSDFDDEADDLSPIRKKQKRLIDKKDKLSLRGRPRKTDNGVLINNYSNHKNPRLSNDAKEGIEVIFLDLVYSL